jgi:hypothetical protein
MHAQRALRRAHACVHCRRAGLSAGCGSWTRRGLCSALSSHDCPSDVAVMLCSGGHVAEGACQVEWCGGAYTGARES